MNYYQRDALIKQAQINLALGYALRANAMRKQAGQASNPLGPDYSSNNPLSYLAALSPIHRSMTAAQSMGQKWQVEHLPGNINPTVRYGTPRPAPSVKGTRTVP